MTEKRVMSQKRLLKEKEQHRHQITWNKNIENKIKDILDNLFLKDL